MAMSSARRPRERSSREWAVRGGVAAVALALGYVSTTETLAFAIGKSKVERGYALSPGDGRIAGELAEQAALREADPAQRARADRLAHQALDDEPLAVSALTALALTAQLAGDTQRARRLFLHSDALSRRELSTRLWLIEDAVERGNVVGALRHYDIALRTARAAPDLLFPVLTGAIADPTVAAALARRLTARPAWGEAFVNYIGASDTDPVVRAAFIRRLALGGYPVPETAQVGVLNALVAAGRTREGWAYYASLRSGADRRQSRDPTFAMQPQIPTTFDWTPVMNDAGINASIQRTREGKGIFDFAAPSTVGGIVLQQTQLLPRGRYRLAGVSAGIDQLREGRPYWQLACADGREIGRVDLPNSAENDGRFAGDIDFDGACPVQTLRLIARPSPNVGGVTGQIEQVRLAPVGSGR